MADRNLRSNKEDLFKAKDKEGIPKELRDFNKPGLKENKGASAEEDTSEEEAFQSLEEDKEFGSEEEDELKFQEDEEEGRASKENLAGRRTSSTMLDADGNPVLDPQGNQVQVQIHAAPPAAAGAGAGISKAAWDRQALELQAMKDRMDTIMALQTKKTSKSNIKLDKFSGFKDERSAVVWWSKLEAVTVQNGWDETETIAAASEAMKGDAEDWNFNRLFKRRNRVEEDDEETLAGWKRDFFLQFDQAQSVASMTESIANLKQKPSENCSVFFVRVDMAFNRVVSDYITNMGWTDPVKPVAGDPRDLGNADFRNIQTLINFKDGCLVETHFVNGLHDNVKKVVLPKVTEYRKAGDNILQKVKEIEATLGKASSHAGGSTSMFSNAQVATVEEAIGDMDEEVKFNVLAALRGRGGGRGGDRGRGGRGSDRGAFRGDRGYGGYRGGSDRGYRGGGRGGYQSSYVTDADIRKRERARFCHTCKQWAKHKDHECKLTAARISAITPMSQQHDKPNKEDLFDLYYDGDASGSGAGGASASGN